MKKEKIALFDFCETIVNFQTADQYVHFTRNQYNFFSMRLINRIYEYLRNHGVINKLSAKFPNASINKRFILFQLFGLSKNKLEESAVLYYNQRLKPNVIPCIIKKIEELQKTGYRIIIISGGYDIYLKYFAQDHGITDVYSSRIKFLRNRCCGILDGKDCLGTSKTEILNKVFTKEKISHSVSFSDSASDLPLLRWTDEAMVVRRSDRQRWSEEFQEMVWEK